MALPSCPPVRPGRRIPPWAVLPAIVESMIRYRDGPGVHDTIRRRRHRRPCRRRPHAAASIAAVAAGAAARVVAVAIVLWLMVRDAGVVDPAAEPSPPLPPVPLVIAARWRRYPPLPPTALLSRMMHWFSVSVPALKIPPPKAREVRR